MFTKTHLADLTHLDSLVDNPLGSIAIPYVEALNAQHYARYTIERKRTTLPLCTLRSVSFKRVNHFRCQRQ